MASGNDAVRYVPDDDANGDDSFTTGSTARRCTTVHISITPSNDDPIALAGSSLSIPANAGAVDVHALANDSDVDGDTLTITANTNPAKGWS